MNFSPRYRREKSVGIGKNDRNDIRELQEELGGKTPAPLVL